MEDYPESPRPAKRARYSETKPEEEYAVEDSARDTDLAATMCGTNTPIDEMGDDLYGTPSAVGTPKHTGDGATSHANAQADSSAQHGQAAQPGFIPGIPGLGMLSSATLTSQSPQDTPQLDLHTSAHDVVRHAEPMAVDDNSEAHAAEAAAAQPGVVSGEAPQERVSEDAGKAASSSDQDVQMDSVQADIAMVSQATIAPTRDNNNDPTSALLNLLEQADHATDDSAPAEPKGKQPADPEFLEAAKAQHGNEEAEWQYDTSDEEESSDDSSDDSSSDEDSDDEDYEMLDPATAARMLMDDAGEDDDGGDKISKNHQVRTKNEKPEEIVPKPDVTVTADMKITPLGAVENVVDNMILVKANTSGEYQVLEAGSVLCLENREVIGAVAETLGRVQEPLYIVAFTRASDITDAGITEGSKIFYVDAHSTFVFTEPLKNLKGTDASNLHDEELPEEEMEFSDDEAEAAYKRAKKEAKKNRNAEKNQPRGDAVPSAAQPYTGGAINYDDEPEDAYTPLARPDNLQQMLANGIPVEERARQANPGRGRGDRGRGGRGRGDRSGRGDRGRGGRVGGDAARGGRKGPSKSFPDNHNQQTPNSYQQQPLPQKPAAPQAWSASQAPQQSAVPQFSYPQFGQQHQLPQSQPPQAQAPFQPQGYAPQPFTWPQMANPQQYQQFQQFLSNFAGQAGQQQFQAPPMPPSTSGGNIPAGAFVNPNFFPGQQQQQQPPHYPQQGGANTQGAAQGPSPEAVQGAHELLRRLGGQQQ